MATVINVAPASQVATVEINNRVLDVVVSKEVKNVEVVVSARSNIDVEITRAVSQTGVQKIIAGDNITITPSTGIGNVTISAASVTNVANANHANIADVANSVSVANVVGIGNIATINLNGNVNTILYGTGVWGSVPNTAQANYANFAGTALHANVADVANLVAGGNVSGPVANAIHAVSSNTSNVAYSVSGANVVGTVAQAAHAEVANSVSGSNVSGSVSQADFANVANSVSGSNVVGIVANATHAITATTATSVAGANVTGTVALATHANVADLANSVSGSNVTGTVALATHANIADVANLVVGANVSGDVSGANHANISDVANSVSGANVTGAVSSALHAVISDSANSVSGANVTGTVANATYATTSGSATTAGTVTTNAQPNITSLGTIVGLASTGNISAPFFIGNVVGNISGNIVVPGANTNILYNNDGNAGASAGFSFDSVSNTVTVTGNVNADYFNGDGSGLSNITAGNITGQVANSLVAGTVYTNAQPNITSLGTLDSLVVTGNIQSYANISGGYIFGDGSYLTGIGNLSAARGYWGSFYSNVSQTISSTTTAYPVILNNTDPDSYGVFISNSSRINFQYAGTFNLQFSAQFVNTNTAIVEASVWLRKNGVDIPDSRGACAITDKQGGVNGQIIESWNYILKLNAGDYLELMWQAEDTSVSMEYLPGGTTPTTPASPSIIVTAQQVTNVQPVELQGAMTGNIVGNGYSLLNIASITSLDGITANTFTGNGAPLTNLTGANVVGDVSGANHANISDVANSVSGSNVVGQVANSLIAGTVYTNAQPNITSVGILNGLEVSGNITPTSNVLYNLGNNTNRFKDLYLSGNTIYLDGTTISTDVTGNILLGNLTVDTTTGTINGANVSGDVSGANHANISDVANSVAGANVTGTVALATHANVADVANSVSGSNVVGQVSSAGVADVAYYVDGANVGGVVAAATSASEADVAYSVDGANVVGDVSGANHANIADVAYAVDAANIVGIINATTAVTVTAASQPNITDVGILNSITVAGNIQGYEKLFLGTGTANLPFTGPTIIAKNQGATYVQAGLINETSTGSSDWVAYADNSTDAESWADMGFTGSGFNDANYAITGPNDGYFFVQGDAANVYGGNLVIATGQQGFQKDIVFATGGFDTTNEFMRINNGTGTNRSLMIVDTTESTDASTGTITTAGGVGIAGNLNVGSKLAVTDAANLYVPGGTSGQVLTTDGLGNLSFTTVTSGGSVAGANTEVQFNDGGSFGASTNFTFNKVTNTLSATNISGNGSGLSSITGSNVVGSVSQSNYANIANSVDGANVTGTVANATYATTSGTANTILSNTIASGTNYLLFSSISANGSALTYKNTNLTFNAASGLLTATALAGNGGNLSSLPAGNLTGTINTARLSGAYTGVTGLGTLTSLNSSGTITAPTFVSNATTGTSPFTVTSTTRVANLNVETAGTADSATTAGTVTTAAQPNITSLGTLTSMTTSGTATANTLVSSGSAGDEGGEIRLALAQTNTTLSTSVTMDIYQNKLRFFETGGTNRGAYIDLSAASIGVGSNLLAGGGGGGTPGGANTQLQFNNNGSFGGISTVTYDGVNLSLGAVGNVKVTGGVSNDVLKTDGTGNLSFGSIAENLVVVGRAGTVPIAINNYTMNVEARSGNVLVYVN